MKHSTFLLRTSLYLLLSTPLFAQEEKALEPLADGVVAEVGDASISLEDYKDFLWTRYGKRSLNQMIDHLLVKQTAHEYGLQIDLKMLQDTFDARLGQSKQGRNDQDFERTLQEAGQTLDMFRSNLLVDLQHEQLLDQLVMATRVATDDRIQRAFDANYGAGGVKVRVRHILIMPHFLRAEKIRTGVKPAEIDAAALKSAARELADACYAELAGGADFTAMVDKYSHDQVSRQSQGELPSYRPGLYGPSFTAAVTDLPVGQNSMVLESGAGFHIVQVLDRQVTKLQDVRAELVDEVMHAVPTWQDREQVLAALREAGEIKLW